MSDIRETSISWFSNDKSAILWTGEAAMKNHMNKLCEEYPDHFKLDKESENNKYIIADKNLLTVRRPITNRKPMSEEQRIASAERLAIARANKKKSKVD